MKLKLLTTITVFVGLSTLTPAYAENLEHSRQLLSSKQCPQCDLSRAGLVFADLTGANLAGANLTGANLSQTNLQGADLRGANLTGASLYGANLTGAKLDGANLTAADLRTAYLSGASLESAILTSALLQDAIGVPLSAGNAQEFYRWAMQAADQKNYGKAIADFNEAILREPNFAAAYMGRSVARLQLGDQDGAIADSQKAETLFRAQGHPDKAEVAQKFAKQVQSPSSERRSGSNFFQQLVGAVSTILQLFLAF